MLEPLDDNAIQRRFNFTTVELDFNCMQLGSLDFGFAGRILSFHLPQPDFVTRFFDRQLLPP